MERSGTPLLVLRFINFKGSNQEGVLKSKTANFFMANDIKLPDSARTAGHRLKKAIYTIIGISIVAVLMLFWLIYFKPPAVTELPWIKNLSALNATFNSLSTIFLLLGFNEIRKKQFDKHMNYMISAFITSALF